MALTEVFGAGILVLGLLLWVQKWWKERRLPPGPTPIPFLGNIFHVTEKSLAVDAMRIGKQYGDLFTLQIYTSSTVILNSYEVIKELLMSKEYAEVFGGRELGILRTEVFPDGLIFQSPANGHKYLRNVVMRGVKQYGTALKRIEALAQEELKVMTQRLRKHEGKTVDPMNDINTYVVNIMMILVCGERFDMDHKMIRISHEVAADFDLLMNTKIRTLLHSVPFARYLYPPLRRCIQRMKRNNEEYTRFVEGMREESSRNHPECLFALLQSEMESGHISKNNVKGLSMDMLLAGVLTTSPTFYTTLLALAVFPEVQKRAREEILKVVGCDRLPGLSDKDNLPFCQATLLEVFRYITPAPLPGPRTVTKDYWYRGYFFPKDTVFTYNVFKIHHEEDFWEKPFEFDPTRFLDKEGNVVPPEDEKRQRMLAFGLGKRSCVGETLSRVRIFLGMTAILQNFDLEEDPNFPLPSADPRKCYVNLLTMPPRYKLRFIPRG